MWTMLSPFPRHTKYNTPEVGRGVVDLKSGVWWVLAWVGLDPCWPGHLGEVHWSLGSLALSFVKHGKKTIMTSDFIIIKKDVV